MLLAHLLDETWMLSEGLKPGCCPVGHNIKRIDVGFSKNGREKTLHLLCFLTEDNKQCKPSLTASCNSNFYLNNGREQWTACKVGVTTCVFVMTSTVVDLCRLELEHVWASITINKMKDIGIVVEANKHVFLDPCLTHKEHSSYRGRDTDQSSWNLM